MVELFGEIHEFHSMNTRIEYHCSISIELGTFVHWIIFCIQFMFLFIAFSAIERRNLTMQPQLTSCSHMRNIIISQYSNMNSTYVM